MLRQRTLWVAAFALLAFALVVQGKEVGVGKLSTEEIEQQLQHCPLIEALNEHKLATTPQTSGFTARLFTVLFPASPAINTLLSVLYISGPPNFLLAFCPPDIDPSSLSVMVAFAVGGLLGDTLFHLLPEIFLGEDSPEHVRFVMVEPNKNLLLGVAIMVGLLSFVALDKTLRIATGGEVGHDHSHSHASIEAKTEEKTGALSSASSTGTVRDPLSGEMRQRKSGDTTTTSKAHVLPEKEVNPSAKLGGYLNIIADFTHNITDGLAIASSFYASPTVGATTTVAIFFHEVPHEVGDFALLIQNGFSKKAAIGAQFLTAAGALVGALAGIAIQELGGSSEGAVAAGAGLFGTSLQLGDLLLPWTAGTFLYVGTVAVIPELLETGPNKLAETKKTLTQFAAMALGAGIMLAISWN
ncbi:hypothetical protein AAFC00_004742 [Neodothiora populina]|uniref:Uncharacterized protein n=1 Tax=Neodothiora populina TaxID=2781224 RepID=A0ABR3P3B8_9PEZI